MVTAQAMLNGYVFMTWRRRYFVGLCGMKEKGESGFYVCLAGTTQNTIYVLGSSIK